MHHEELKFYPAHPSDEKTHHIETTPMPLKEQSEPYAVRKLADAFRDDLDTALSEYQDRRFEVTGVAIKVGPDIHHKPSVELSDCADGHCHALCIFPTDEHYQKVAVGDRVTVRANYLVMSNWFGVVMKYSELVNVQKNQ